MRSMPGPQVAVHGKVHVQIVVFTRPRVGPAPPIQVALRSSTFRGMRAISGELARDNVADAVKQLATAQFPDPSQPLGPYDATPQWMRYGVCAGELSGFAVCCHMGAIKGPVAMTREGVEGDQMLACCRCFMCLLFTPLIVFILIVLTTDYDFRS